MTQQGIGRHIIAREIGVSHRALTAYMARRGIPSGKRRGGDPHKRIDREALRILIETEHLTHQQAAEQLDCSVSAVERIAKSMGLQTARTGPRSGADHPEWKGGRCLDKHGYVLIFAPLHPLARKPRGTVPEHRLVMEVVLGRYLQADEVVDHRDDHPQHNWPDNLKVYASNADHLRGTLTGRAKASPRSSIPGAYGNNQKIDRCPELHETLAQCPENIRLAVERHIRIHQPTIEQSHLPRSKLLRSGPIEPAFPEMSTA